MMQTVSRPRKIKIGSAMITFDLLGGLLMAILSILCLLPFVMLLSASFSSEQSILTQGYGLISGEFSTKAYQTLFEHPGDVLNSLGITMIVTVCGTVFGLLVTAMAAYVVARPDFKYRNRFSFYFYFTTLFNGGLLSTYIFMVRYLNLKNSLLAVILPLAVNVFYMLILKSFMQGVPFSIIESAKIDGAGEYRIFFQLVLPLTKAGLATVGLFLALDYWKRQGCFPPSMTFHQISIHSSHTGRDPQARPRRARRSDFNPLFPYGKRPSLLSPGARDVSISIHSSHTGRDPRRPVGPYKRADFNPLFPYGKRQPSRCLFRLFQHISIHSSHTGRDPVTLIVCV